MLSPSIARFLIRAPSTLQVHYRAPLHNVKLSTFYTLQHYTRSDRWPALGTRSAASSVSNRPGSQTLPHAYQNIKEETGNSAADLAKTIAGNVNFVESVAPSNYSFVS